MLRAFLIPLTVLASISFGACTTHQDQVPGIAGPSGFAVSIDVTATPDHVRQDGESQSAVVVSARDANGQPIAAMAMRLDMSIGGTAQDFGTLSARNAVTGKDGRATVVYTAPASVAGAAGSGTTIEIVATSVGTNAQTSQSQSVSINLVPPGVILPPAGTPIAAFTVSPIPVAVGVAAQFDATSSRPGTGASRISSYSWVFGDGSAPASGAVVNHTFAAAGSFSVALTVTNDRGFQTTTTQTVVAGVTILPTAAFVFSPATPVVGQVVSFNAASSTAAPGRRLTSYSWDFGDGTTKTGVTATHDFVNVGVFAVTLTVADDLGQLKTVSQSVPVTAVATTAPTAAFEFSPAAPQVAQPVSFNAGTSTAGPGRTLTSYAWNFGDGLTAAGVTTTHAFAAAGVYSVVLSVTDDQGQARTLTKVVPVSAVTTTTPVAQFVFSPSKPGVGAAVQFNGQLSRAQPGRTIVSYQWNWGDGLPDGAGVTVPHDYGSAGIFTVVLTVLDDLGQSGTATQQVPIGQP
jgi:PKD repeat protein